MLRMLFVVAIIVACALPSFAIEEGQSVDDKAIEMATKVGNFQEVYRILLQLAQRGDARAQFNLSVFLTAKFLTIAPDDQQRAVALLWLRKSAQGHWTPAMKRLSDAYKWGWMEVARDVDVSDCYREAVGAPVPDATKCFALEVAKGYATQ